MELPTRIVPLNEFIPYLAKQSRNGILNGGALDAFQTYESKLREIFAQEPDSETIADPHVNVVPIYAGFEEQLKVKPRNLESESARESEKYLLPLHPTFRKEEGTLAAAPSLSEFKENFRLFSESSLVDLDWSNVVVAGSAVTTCLLPLTEEQKSSRKAQREFYHEKIAPASDVDLFIYGLNEEQAIEKIKQIEKCIRNSVLEETTVIRTKNALTIASRYPTRHVQIVLRLYKSVSEILTGFDVDCSCTAFDGSQVWASPRALASFVTQTNTIDLTRRSPSYENRLAKYSHRGFEVYWSGLDRSRVDPTIFERSFTHVVGLARLLVMEKLPTAGSRDRYVDQRRSERGRPPSTKEKFYNNPHGNFKERQPEDIAEWVEEEDVSSYHTFTIPYGPKYTAKKIERLLYKKDLLLNAEWNKSKERTVDLHRHPAFFGAVQDVIEDCCGFCPSPATEEEIEIAEEESRRFVSGKIQFMKDDPGRQAIGSFNPITDSDWTEMAYIGDTARLCQAIVDGDLECVKKCCAREDFNVDQRDHTGRMPLHLAVMCGTPEIVQYLVDRGAKLVARVAGGSTVLHMAAARGNPEILRTILRKSEANKAEHSEKTEKPLSQGKGPSSGSGVSDVESGDSDDDDISFVQSVSEGPYAATQGSMVMVKKSASEIQNPPEENEDEGEEPNFYDNVDVLSWDMPISPLHLALLNGYAGIVDILATEFGANIAQPIVWRKPSYQHHHDVTLSMALVAHNPLEKSKEVLKTLLELGASSTQADMHHVTALHSIVMEGESALIDTLFELDGPAAKLAINHPALGMSYGDEPRLPLSTAIKDRSISMIKKLLEHGASLSISGERVQRFWARWGKNNSGPVENHLAEPIIIAARFASPAIIKVLLDAGADPNSLTPEAHSVMNHSGQRAGQHRGQQRDQSVLDIVKMRMKYLRDDQAVVERQSNSPEPPALKSDSEYLEGLREGSYEYCFIQNELEIAKAAVRAMKSSHEEYLKKRAKEDEEKKPRAEWVAAELSALENIKAILLEKGAKTFQELYANFKGTAENQEVKNQAAQAIDEAATTENDFSIARTFHDNDLGKIKSASYMQLFEAAWEGDIRKVKALTLGSWGADHKKPPLHVSVRDRRGVTPFVIAVARGHYELAKVILEIADAQYAPRTEAPTRKKYEIVVDAGEESGSECCYSESESEEEDNHGVSVRFDLVDEQHTIDDVRELGNIVKSSTSPADMVRHYSDLRIFFDAAENKHVFDARFKGTNSYMSPFIFGAHKLTAMGTLENLCSRTEYAHSSGLFTYAVQKNNLVALKFIMEQLQKYQGPTDEDAPLFLPVASGEFERPMENGYTEILEHIISQTGAEFPLQALIKKAGVKLDSKPKYYQGLTVYGSKREDWAAEDGRHRYRRFEAEENLLLRAAFTTNLESIKWFLSDIPEQKYKEFASMYADDKRIKAFTDVPGGFEGALSSWLNARRDMALHCAVLGNATKETGVAHVKLILEAIPTSLNAKNKTGMTALQVAFIKRRVMAAKTIVEAGADQTVRDETGRNLLHTILTPSMGEGVIKSPNLFRALSGLLDKEVLRSLATQRSHVGRGTHQYNSWSMLTPLAEWLATAQNPHPDMLRTILEITGGQELYVLDGEGNYPIHQVVRKNFIDLARVMLERDPSLALLENATGITPLELVENKIFDAVLSWLRNSPRRVHCRMNDVDWRGNPVVYEPLNVQHTFGSRTQKITDPNELYKKDGMDTPRFWPTDRVEGKLYHLLHETASRNGIKRRLASLRDANQLVKRLEARKNLQQNGQENNASERDEVSHFMSRSQLQMWELDEILEKVKDDADESEF
ncbi:hypothetical protein CIRG_01367 [Coccidioides immitis RMSCC 2394]|uniref:Ankyrin repeat protein n=1 Tax=Coccidioides immitis RMSCC 2394 TaxID=404692 RepID=A0A0J7AV59_COCIT|nr:hypothetical protein CIRG_01367 [Coccidioides immitis RMSCC 2394]